MMKKFWGEAEADVRALFERARSNAPSIVFIDEIDAVGGRRGGASDGESRARLLNQLLTEIDGFAGSAGILTVGATNRRDTLDPALVRGGRLERAIEVGLPGQPGRRELLARQTAGMRLADDVDLDAVAAATAGLAPADTAGLVRAAGMRALLREGDDIAVEQADLLAALAELRETAVQDPQSGGGGGELSRLLGQLGGGPAAR